MRVSASLAVGILSTPVFSAVVSPLQLRAVAGQGWSLQSGSCPSGTQSCGNGSCCPSTSFCQATGNGEVDACCPTSSNCRGSVEGAPGCASPAWSLWKGSFGNGFCCEVGLTGAFVNGGSVAGICVTSVPAGYSTASLATQGTGSSVSSAQSATSTSSVSQTKSASSIKSTTSISQTTKPTSSKSSTSTAPPTSTKVPRAVFAHYMVGQMSQDEANQDVTDAIAVGFDAFALNTHDITDQWALQAIGFLFNAADQYGFKLFISFDMSWRTTIAPSQIPSFLVNYIHRPSYYTINGRPFVSTYDGGFIDNSDWASGFQQPLQSQGINPYFVPNFGDWGGWPNNFFSNYPVADGAFDWESAWPTTNSGISNVTDTDDQNLLQQARAANKIYMMPVSSFQFKWYQGNQWYRIGEVNLPQRFEQVLALQPDLVELITWNDAGESHYIGNFFQDQILGTTIGDYANGFDHTGWQQLITPFIKAYKSGVATSGSQILPPGSTPVGSLWYRTLLKTASCSPQIANYGQAQDTLNYAVLLPSSGYTIKVYSNNQLIGSFPGNAGLNYYPVPGLAAGSGQYIQVMNSAGSVVASATGTKQVTAQSTSSICNWNYEVVGLS